MTDTSTAGWYPDPEGQPGLQRWWNGMSWSASTRSMGNSTATVAVQDPGAGTYPLQYDVISAPEISYPETPEAWTPVPPEPVGAKQTRRFNTSAISGRAWFGVTAGGVVLALVIAVVVYVGGSNDPEPPIAIPGGSSEPQIRPPGQTRIVDEIAGVAYPYLGTYWQEFVSEVLETTSTAGQFIVTQEDVPTGGQFIAQVTSGPVRPEFGYAGPTSLATIVTTLQASVRGNYYPAPNTIENLRDEAVTVDGATAYLLEFNLVWDVAGYDSTGERAALILIETGRSAPALIYISIPNTHAELYGIVDRVIAEIDVLP